MTSAAAPRVDRAPFGTMPDGMAVERVTLRGADGFEASVITYGAALQSLTTRDRVGRSEDVVFGHDDLESYLAARRFFGATIGRYANRIARARCMLDGTELRLDANNGANMLHGGHDGFDRKLWRIVDLAAGPVPALVLSYASQVIRYVGRVAEFAFAAPKPTGSATKPATAPSTKPAVPPATKPQGSETPK